LPGFDGHALEVRQAAVSRFGDSDLARPPTCMNIQASKSVQGRDDYSQFLIHWTCSDLELHFAGLFHPNFSAPNFCSGRWEILTPLRK
jgi:hypothetical protein